MQIATGERSGNYRRKTAIKGGQLKTVCPEPASPGPAS